MKKLCLILILGVFLKVECSAQKGSSNRLNNQYAVGSCAANFNKTPFVGLNNAATIVKLLSGIIPNLQAARVALSLNYVHESMAGFHYSFTQLFEGIAIYQSEIKVNTDKANNVTSVFDNSYNTQGWSFTVSEIKQHAVIFLEPGAGTPVLAECYMMDGHLESIMYRGEVLFQRDVNTYYAMQDTTVTGKVFNPDPLTSSRHLYTDIASVIGNDTIYCDNNNGADKPWMDAQEQIKSFKASFDNGVFSLQTPYLIMSKYDTVAPEQAPPVSLTPQFYFHRSDTGFTAVNAFYHISTHRDYVASLGFHCGDSLTLADAHYYNQDDSYFSPASNPRRLYFGIGNVPDAEDADVVVHEYSHALSYNCSPGSNVGLERNSLDEAFADYNAGAYSKALSDFNDVWVYNWDGHNQYWPGRILNSTAVYPGSAHLSGNIYLNGEMWSSVLFALNGDLGRGITDSLIYEAHYSYAQNISMPHAALLLIEADSLLFNGAHYCQIYQRLLEHAFVNPVSNGCVSGVQQADPMGFSFMQSGNSFTLYNSNQSTLHVQVLSITGQLVTPVITGSDAIIRYQNAALATGIYLVNVMSTSGSATFKWINQVH